MSSVQVPTPGQLTTVFSQKRESAQGASTATLKDLTTNAASSKRTSRERRLTQDSSNAAVTPQSMQHVFLVGTLLVSLHRRWHEICAFNRNLLVQIDFALLDNEELIKWEIFLR